MPRKRPIPSSLWIALIALGAFGAWFLFAGLARGDPIEVVAGLVCGGLLWALAKAQRWAHLLTLLIIIAGVVSLVLDGRGPQAAVAVAVTAFVWAPLLIDYAWFWRHPNPLRRHHRPARV